VLVRAMTTSGDTVAVRDVARDPAAGPGRRWRQQWLDALPQRIGQESIHQGAHSREHPKTSLAPQADSPFRNVQSAR
jgi:hypothetical protein